MHKINKMSLFLKLRMLLCIFLRRKITIRRILNFLNNQTCYLLRLAKRSGSPSILLVEPSNRCNLACVGCHDNNNKIYDYRHEQYNQKISLGYLDLSLYQKAIANLAKDILLVGLYLKGEPLLNKNIFLMIRYANDFKIPTLMSTNGMLLNEQNNLNLVNSGLDFIKISISGFHQTTYQKFNRQGDIELIKSNINNLVKIKNQHQSRLLIMIDYILFNYNQEEFELIRKWCAKSNLICIPREGRYLDSFKTIDHQQSQKPSINRLCTWLWHIAVLNWDGGVLPCCMAPAYSDPPILGQVKNMSLPQIWNGSKYHNFRNQHIAKGRDPIFICHHCNEGNLGFQLKRE